VSHEEFDLDAYTQDEAEYQSTQTDNVAYVGDSALRFYVVIDPSAIVRPIYERQPSAGETDVRRAYAETVQRALDSVDPAVATHAEPWGGPKTGGPIPEQTYVVQLIGLALSGMATVVLLVEFADVVKRVIDKAKSLSKKEVAVSDGLAVILAADAIYARTGEGDLALAFVTSLNEYLPELGEMDSAFDGWLVGFRSPTHLRIVHIDRLGKASVPDASLPIDWTAR
jgi:hypothetical protein